MESKGKRDRWQRTWDLFHAALEKEAGERAAFVDSACADDAELGAEVNRLLQIHGGSAGILDGDPLDPGTVTFGGGQSLLGTSIGAYQLREVVGEGGMGVVYSAEQSSPVRRRVALKLVRAGLDNREVLARFESERQALAIMDHPRIAKVFDAGVTDDGRPYFVMEYVPGIPITEYCDLRALDLGERLELFLQVCEAIEHAHARGIIHRDIKPSNLLVASVDGRPSLKVIDFGVAKAMNQRLTERTLFTRQGALVGTPGYMSPEQAGTTPLEVDARTDIYALGVVLYELLAGAQPFDPKTLRNVALAEMLRILREEEPPPLGARVTSLGAEATEVAKRRHLDVQSLVRKLRGELEWITMRALDKDAARRYASTSEFARDIRRHLAHEPVLAGPPSTAYRLGKFLRRHRTAVAVASVFTVVVFGFGTLLQVQSSRLARARDHGFLRQLLAPGEAGVTLREVWPKAIDVLGGPSPDGRFISFTDWETGDLALHDLLSGEDRRLTDKNTWDIVEFAEFSVVSPDGARVAYGWYRPEGFYDLRVVSVADGRVSTLFGRPDTPWLRPLGWSPDGRHVLAWLSRHSGIHDVALVGEGNGEVNVLYSTTDSEQPGAITLSPDGRTLLYSVRQDLASEKRDIRIRTVDGSRDHALVVHSANDVPMGWSPDGRHVLFLSDRTGRPELWAVAVGTEGADGSPTRIGSSLGDHQQVFPMGFVAGGSFVYGTHTDSTDVYTAPLDASGRAGTARKVTELYEGTNRWSDWSPDGKRLAWISKRRDAYVLIIADVDGGGRTEVPLSGRLLRILGGSRWSPDGTRILVNGRARGTESWRGLLAIDVSDGSVEQIAAADTNGSLGQQDWSPDGKYVYLVRRKGESSAIVVLDVDTRRERLLLQDDIGNVAVSPDGRWIAYTSNTDDDPGENAAIYVVPTGGGEPEPLFESGADRGFNKSTPLAWSADSDYVLFATRSAALSETDELRELMMIPREGGPVEPVGLEMKGLTNLRVHPDGNRVAFDSGRRDSALWFIDNLLPELDSREH